MKLRFASLVAVLLVVGGFASPQSSARHVRPKLLPTGCTDEHPCHYKKGTYFLGGGEVLPGLRLKLPSGWSSSENGRGELNLYPATQPSDRLFVWVDMVAVKSSGPGHGTTILSSVGTTAADLISWLMSNHDFVVVSAPTQTTIAGRIPATTLTVVVSPSTNYDDPTSDCPSYPRCADLFTNPTYWGSNSYGIGGDEEAQISIATIKRAGVSHTMFVVLDGSSAADLQTLAANAQPVLSSFWLPKGITPG